MELGGTNATREATVDSPLELRVQDSNVPAQTVDASVRMAERLWDALAGLMILSGITLFLLARNGLASIAAGTHVLPPGVPSFVQRADYFSAQSSLGLWMVGVGVAVGLVSSIRHALRRRAVDGTRAASTTPTPTPTG
jgi:bacteriorhodopsin